MYKFYVYIAYMRIQKSGFFKTFNVLDVSTATTEVKQK